MNEDIWHTLSTHLCAGAVLEEKREEPQSRMDASRGKSPCGDTEIRLCLVCLGQRKEAGVAERVRGHYGERSSEILMGFPKAQKISHGQGEW